MSEDSSRHGKFTQENREEAARLKAIWERTYEERRLAGIHTQAAFGAAFGIGNQAAVGFFLNGPTALSKKAARGFAKGLKCSIAEFSPRLAAEIDALAEQVDEHEDFALVQQADVKLSAGHGHIVFHEGQRSALSFRRSFLKEVGVSEKNAVIVQVSGSSMEPTIHNGAVLLVNRADTTVRSGNVYAFRFDGGLLVKRLHHRGDHIVAVSDNPDREAYPDLIMSSANQEVEILGRALWMGARL